MGGKAALDHGQVDQILGEPFLFQHLLHHRNIALGSGKPPGEYTSPPGLEKIDEVLHLIVQGKGNIRIGEFHLRQHQLQLFNGAGRLVQGKKVCRMQFQGLAKPVLLRKGGDLRVRLAG